MSETGPDSIPQTESGPEVVSVPDVAPDVGHLPFGERTALMRRYAELLRTRGIERGLIGPREADRIWDRHILNCARIQELVPEGVEVADIGSGAGLPGLVLAIARPDLRVHLVEPLLRRSTWLSEVVEELDLSGTVVTRCRAEELHGRYQADVVTARAVAALGQLAEWCLPLVRPGGSLLALKGDRAAEELDAALPVLDRHGVSESAVHELGALGEGSATVVRIVRATGTLTGSSGRDAGRARRPGRESRRRPRTR